MVTKGGNDRTKVDRLKNGEEAVIDLKWQHAESVHGPKNRLRKRAMTCDEIEIIHTYKALDIGGVAHNDELRPFLFFATIMTKDTRNARVGHRVVVNGCWSQHICVGEVLRFPHTLSIRET